MKEKIVSLISLMQICNVFLLFIAALLLVVERWGSIKGFFLEDFIVIYSSGYFWMSSIILISLHWILAFSSFIIPDNVEWRIDEITRYKAEEIRIPYSVFCVWLGTLTMTNSSIGIHFFGLIICIYGCYIFYLNALYIPE